MPKIIYNTTYLVAKDSSEAWLSFMKNRLKGVEKFAELRICRILTESEEDSFAVQLQAPLRQDIETWIETEGGKLHHSMRQQFGESILFFSTFMEEI